MAASERRFGSRHRNPFSTSRAVRLIVGAIVRGGHRIRGTKTISPRPVARTVDYPPRVRAVLDHAKATHGDTVLVHAKGERYEGTLMPHHGFSGEDILTLKLPSGYNVGIAVGDVESVEVTAKPPVTRPERHLLPRLKTSPPSRCSARAGPSRRTSTTAPAPSIPPSPQRSSSSASRNFWTSATSVPG